MRMGFDRSLMLISYFYLSLPVGIFVFCWLRWYYAIPILFILLFALTNVIKNMEIDSDFKLSKKESIITCSALMVFGLWVYISGIGGYVWQNCDHDFRNAIFNDLIKFDWPVRYDYINLKIDFNSLSNYGALAYYIGFWLPSAVVGKIFGLKVAYFTLYLWSFLGIALCYFLLSRLLKKFSMMYVFAMIFWSGLDFLGYIIICSTPPSPEEHIEFWIRLFQYSSNTTLLFWVFNQTIVPWLIVLVILHQKNLKNILFICSLCLLSAPFPFVGLLPCILVCILFGITKMNSKLFFSSKNLDDSDEKLKFLDVYDRFIKNLKNCISFQNLVAAPIIVIIVGLYFAVNVTAVNNNQAGLVINFVPPILFFKWYGLFCIMEFGIYVLWLIPPYRREKIFVISVFTLLLLPVFKMGGNNDFVMRASIPSLYILMIYMIAFLNEYFKNIRFIHKIMIISVLLLGAITPSHEITRSIHNTLLKKQSQNHLMGTLYHFRDVENFVAYKAKNSLFFKYLSK